MKTKRLTKAQERALAWVRDPRVGTPGRGMRVALRALIDAGLVHAKVQFPFASFDYELTPRGEAL